MKTPFGRVLVEVKDADGNKVEADVQEFEKESDERFPVDGRYLIEVRMTPKVKQAYFFTISFEPEREITDSDVESGEDLELKSWLSGNFKWSLGAVDDEWLLALRKVDLTHVDYLENGIALQINGIPVGEPFMLPFGVAWQETENLEDANTWFMAAPADMYPSKWLQQEET